jgi:type I restriction enzyme M protein
MGTLGQFWLTNRLLPERVESEQRWTMTREQIEARGYDLKAVNSNARSAQDTRTPDEHLTNSWR